MLRHRNPDDGYPVISASDAAAVHGEHRFKTKMQLFLEKQNPEPPVTIPNAAMDRGNRLEPVIGKWVADLLDIDLVEPEWMYSTEHEAHPMIATIDRARLRPDGWPSLVVEIKTYADYWHGELPRYWYWQGVQQAICTDVDSITWAIFDSTLQLHIHVQEVTRDEKLQHIGAVTEFVNWLKLGWPDPEWDKTYEEMSSLYKGEPGTEADLTPSAWVIDELREVQTNKKLWANREDELKAIIAEHLGNADTGLVDGQPAVTWKRQKRTSFDTKTFQRENPDLYKKYETESTFRVLRLKGEK